MTVSVNIVAHSLGLGPGDEVLSTDHEYSPMDHTWRFLAKGGGSTLMVSAPRPAASCPRTVRWKVEEAVDAYSVEGLHGSTQLIVLVVSTACASFHAV